MAKLIKIWQGFSVREKRIIVIAALIGGIFIFTNYVFDPIYASYQDKQNELKSEEALLKKYRHLINSQDKARQRLSEIQAIENGVTRVVLKSATPDLANAELQGIVKNLAKKVGVSFTRISPQKSVKHEGFLEISLKLPFDGDIKQVQGLLYELESASVLFDITSMSIRKKRRKQNDKLRVELVVSAFIRSESEVESDELDTKDPSEKS